MENDSEGVNGKKVQFIEQRDHFIFPSHSLLSLTVASHFLLHCVEYWRYIQEVGSLFPFSFLLNRGMRVDTGWEGQHTLCLWVTRKELLVETFTLETHTHTVLRLHFKQRERDADRCTDGGWYLILNIQTFNAGTHADSHMQNIKSHLIRHLILADKLINFTTHRGTEYKSTMAGSQLQHMSCQPTLFTTLYWFTPTQWLLQKWSPLWLEISHPSST